MPNFDKLFSVQGKVALVTGGSRGIGEMIAAGLVANGARVYISSRKAGACDATAARLSREYGGECVSLPADVSGLEGIEALVGKLHYLADLGCTLRPNHHLGLVPSWKDSSTE